MAAARPITPLMFGVPASNFQELIVGRLLERDRQDHVAAALPWRHALEQLLAPIQHADAGGPSILWRRNNRSRSRAPVRPRACAEPPARRRAAPGRHALGDRNELLDRYDRAERIRDVSKRQQFRPWTDQLFERLEVDFTGLRDRDDLERRARLLAQQLPGHDVRVMLERGNQNLIAGLKLRSCKALRDEVDAFGRAAHEYDFLRVARIDEAPDVFASAFEGVSCALTQRMNAAMHVRVIVLVVVRYRIDDRARALARRGVVEIDERLAVDLLRQNRKVAPNRGGIEAERRWGVEVCAHGEPPVELEACFADAARVRPERRMARRTSEWTRRMRGSGACAPPARTGRANANRRGRSHRADRWSRRDCTSRRSRRSRAPASCRSPRSETTADCDSTAERRSFAHPRAL